jgi:hypothetical protein
MHFLPSVLPRTSAPVGVPVVYWPMNLRDEGLSALRSACSFSSRFESGLYTCKVGALLLEPHLQVLFALVILQMASLKLFALASLELRVS